MYAPRKNKGSLQANLKSGANRRTSGGTRSLPSKKKSVGTAKSGKLGRRSS